MCVSLTLQTGCELATSGYDRTWSPWCHWGCRLACHRYIHIYTVCQLLWHVIVEVYYDVMSNSNRIFHHILCRMQMLWQLLMSLAYQLQGQPHQAVVTWPRWEKWELPCNCSYVALFDMCKNICCNKKSILHWTISYITECTRFTVGMERSRCQPALQLVWG